ncbi:MAG: relaxase domain-containing protein [Chthoniobacterales bacterium]
MLRVTMSVSAEGATKYFDAALSTSDYHASEHGVWGGKGAERLGLAGDVRREDFVSLASNKVPGTKEETLTVRTKDKRITGNLVCASFVHTVTRPIDGIPDPHYHIHGFVFNATFDAQENRWKAGQFMNLKADAPFYEAAFNARLASKLIESGYAIRRTDRDFELASVSREMIEKFRSGLEQSNNWRTRNTRSSKPELVRS